MAKVMLRPPTHKQFILENRGEELSLATVAKAAID
jgi:hypothetical protein